jgi:UDP-N-acetylglucosamine transferase subunit ALG13
VIFVTVGAQMPFDRLVRAADGWAGARQRRDVFAQIGPGAWQPRNVDWCEFLAPTEFRERCEQADVLVAHAGMGSIITALELAKPILVMPRRGDLRETRNDHQIATARQFAEQGKLSVAMDADELAVLLDRLADVAKPSPIGAHASQGLLSGLREFIDAS